MKGLVAIRDFFYYINILKNSDGEIYQGLRDADPIEEIILIMDTAGVICVFWKK